MSKEKEVNLYEAIKNAKRDLLMNRPQRNVNLSGLENKPEYKVECKSSEVTETLERSKRAVLETKMSILASKLSGEPIQSIAAKTPEIVREMLRDASECLEELTQEHQYGCWDEDAEKLNLHGDKCLWCDAIRLAKKIQEFIK